MSRLSEELKLLNGTRVLTRKDLGAANLAASLDDSGKLQSAQIPTLSISSITGLQSALDAKITNPSGGSTGQVLTKTASGETWADAGTGESTYDNVKAISTYEQLGDLADWCAENQGKLGLFTPASSSWWETAGVSDIMKGGHLYAMFTFDAGMLEYILECFAYEMRRAFFPWEFTITSYRRYYTWTEGNTVVINGVTYNLTPYTDGKSTGYATASSWSGFSDTAHIDALDGTYLKISDTERIVVYSDWYTRRFAYVMYQVYNGSTWKEGEYVPSSYSLTNWTITNETIYGYEPTSGSAPVYEERLQPFIADISIGVVPIQPTAISSTSHELVPGALDSWTLTTDSTLTFKELPSGTYGARCDIDINPGTYTLTPGTGLTFVDSLTASKMNRCVVEWRGTNAYLRVLYTFDGTTPGLITVSYSGTTLTMNNVGITYSDTDVTLANSADISYSGTTVTI